MRGYRPIDAVLEADRERPLPRDEDGRGGGPPDLPPEQVAAILAVGKGAAMISCTEPDCGREFLNEHALQVHQSRMRHGPYAGAPAKAETPERGRRRETPEGPRRLPPAKGQGPTASVTVVVGTPVPIARLQDVLTMAAAAGLTQATATGAGVLELGA